MRQCTMSSWSKVVSDGFSSVQQQVFIWSSIRLLLIGIFRTTFTVILTEIWSFSLKKIHSKISSAILPSNLGLILLSCNIVQMCSNGRLNLARNCGVWSVKWPYFPPRLTTTKFDYARKYFFFGKAVSVYSKHIGVNARHKITLLLLRVKDMYRLKHREYKLQTLAFFILVDTHCCTL